MIFLILLSAKGCIFVLRSPRVKTHTTVYLHTNVHIAATSLLTPLHFPQILHVLAFVPLTPGPLPGEYVESIEAISVTKLVSGEFRMHLSLLLQLDVALTAPSSACSQ